MRRDETFGMLPLMKLSQCMSLYVIMDDDPLIHYVYGSHKGRRRAIRSTANSIRLQCLQFIRRLSEDPAKLVQFSYLQTVPYGEVVLQTLALSFWGGPLITKFERTNYQRVEWTRSVEDLSDVSIHVFAIDGSVYLRKWMKSPSWSDNMSATFWRNSLVKRGIVLAKNLVCDLSLVERAALTCKVKSRIVEKTRATIDAAMIKGIPSIIDLFRGKGSYEERVEMLHLIVHLVEASQYADNPEWRPDISELELKLSEHSNKLLNLQQMVQELASKFVIGGVIQYDYNPNEDYTEVELKLRSHLESFLETVKSFNLIYTKEIHPWTHMMEVPQLHGFGPASNRLLEAYNTLLKFLGNLRSVRESYAAMSIGSVSTTEESSSITKIILDCESALTFLNRSLSILSTSVAREQGKAL